MPNSFTPQQIEEFLQEFFDVVGARQYVGARYVPIFGRKGEDTVEWDDRAPYEPLTVVMHLGVSYVSRQYVPTGTPITDTDFWVETYRFNAQVEQYRQEVLQFQSQIDQIREDMESDYVPFPDPATYPKYGTSGQVLTTLTDGSTKWEDPVVPSDEQAEEVITEWLTAHPEATTTVQNGAITDAKINSSSTVFLFRGNLADNVTALSDVMTSGTYFIPRDSQARLTDLPENVPTNTSLQLVNIPYSNYPVQVLTTLFNSYYMWYRIVQQGVVTAWIQLSPAPISVTDSEISANSTIQMYRGNVPGNLTALSECMVAGSYFIPRASLAQYTDLPSNAPTTSSLQLINIPYSNTNYPVQILLTLFGQQYMWYRVVQEGVVTAWIQLSPETIGDSEISANSTIQMYRGNVPDGLTVLSDCMVAGSYFLPRARLAEFTDLPGNAPTNSSMLLVNIPYPIVNSIYPVQILLSLFNSHYMWYRIVQNGAISDWMQLSPESRSALDGKKLVTVGDSYTAAIFGNDNPLTGKNFGYYISKRNNMSFVNSGISGSIMAYDKTYVDDPQNVSIDTRQPFSYQRYLQVPEDTDYLTIWFGINDSNHTYLGSIDDTTSSTFYGAWNKVLSYYLTNRPFMHVGIVVTPNASSTYQQAVREVAAKWGYPVIDLVNGTDSPAFFERTGMSTEAQTLRRDAYGWNTWNGHPNPEWHEFISSSFEEFLKRC